MKRDNIFETGRIKREKLMKQTCDRDPRNSDFREAKIPAKKWGDTEIAERGRSVLVMRARYRSAGWTPHQRGWTDAG